LWVTRGRGFLGTIPSSGHDLTKELDFLESPNPKAAAPNGVTYLKRAPSSNDSLSRVVPDIADVLTHSSASYTLFHHLLSGVCTTQNIEFAEVPTRLGKCSVNEASGALNQVTSSMKVSRYITGQ
jgi:hypothetical protein